MSLLTRFMASAAPKKQAGERLSDYFDNFFKTVTAVSTLGASITFSKIVQTPVTPWVDYGISKETIQNNLSLSWLFFVLDLAITSFAASALSLYRLQAVQYFGTSDSRERRIVMWWAALTTTVLLSLLIAAFIFLGLVVAAYSGPIGWFAVAFTAFYGAICLATVIWQSPIRSNPPPETTSTRLPRRAGSYRYPSQEKGDEYGGPLPDEEEYIYEDSPRAMRAEQGSTPSRMNRQSSIVRPEVIAVPDFTVDLRQFRAMRAADELRYDRRPG